MQKVSENGNGSFSCRWKGTHRHRLVVDASGSRTLTMN